MLFRLSLRISPLVALLATGGCSSLQVKSNPPGARVVWSHDGLEPFRPWPANSWEMDSTNGENQTPLSTVGMFGDTFFVTVEKEGYRRPLPKVVQLYPLKKEELEFELAELPDARTQRLRDQGLVYYEGEWVDPEEMGLVEYQAVIMTQEQAERQRRRDQGLVEYQGEWMPPQEAAERREQERAAAGMVQFKDRWVEPEVAEREGAIDERVETIAAQKAYQDLDPPRILERTGLPQARIRVLNVTEEKLEVLISGPISRQYELAPSEGIGAGESGPISLPSGRYRIAMIPGETTDPQEIRYGSWPLPDGVVMEFQFQKEIDSDGGPPEEYMQQ